MCYAGAGRVVRGQERALPGGLRWRFSSLSFPSFRSVRLDWGMHMHVCKVEGSGHPIYLRCQTMILRLWFVVRGTAACSSAVYLALMIWDGSKA